MLIPPTSGRLAALVLAILAEAQGVWLSEAPIDAHK
jgi:hypothetical protein